jgi:hypothetical protein
MQIHKQRRFTAKVYAETLAKTANPLISIAVYANGRQGASWAGTGFGIVAWHRVGVDNPSPTSQE